MKNKNLTPYEDEASHAKGGKWYPCEENFPACKFLMHEDDLVPTWHAPSEAYLRREWPSRIPANGAFKALAVIEFSEVGFGWYGGTQNTEGSLPVIGQKHLIYMSVGRSGLMNNKVVLGNTDVAGINLRYNGNTVTKNVNDWASIDAGDSGDLPVDGAIAVVTNNNGIGSLYKLLTDGDAVNLKTVGTVSGDFTAPWDAFSGDNLELYPTATSGSKLIAIWGFETFPEDADVAIQWMAANQGKLYPGWAGRS